MALTFSSSQTPTLAVALVSPCRLISRTSSSAARQPVASVARVAALADNAVTAKAGASAHCRSAEMAVVDRLIEPTTVLVLRQVSNTQAPCGQVSLQVGGSTSGD